MIRPRPLTCLLAWAALSAPANGQGFDTLFTVDGSAVHDLFGISVDGIGDLDGDGRGDFVVGASHAALQAGTATVFSGATGVVLFRFQGDAAGDRFGVCVANAGDVDRDGVPDLIVGAHRDDDGGTDAGSARVYSGRTGAVLHTFHGQAAGDEFGTAVAGAGDVDNDGYADLVIGAPCADSNGTDAGRVQVFSGRTGKVLHTFDGDSAHDWHGYAVHGAGDVDRDGFADVIVGACYDDSGTLFNNGSVRVYSGRTGAVLHLLRGAASNDWFGTSVAGVGDLNRDGRDDFAIGAPTADQGGPDSGRVTVVSGINGRVMFQIDGRRAGDQFGVSVRGCGDFNGDGAPDFAVGAFRGSTRYPTGGSVYVVSGRTGTTLLTAEGTASDNRFGIAVGGVDDTNGDGRPEVVAGAVYSDRVASNAGSARLLSGAPLAMMIDPPVLSAATGGTQTFLVDAGGTYANLQYRILGSASGTAPGVDLAANVHVALNYDPYTQLTIDSANSAELPGFAGVLDRDGRATAAILCPPLDASAIGVTLHHAVVLFDKHGKAVFAGNPTPLTFVR